MEGTDELHEVAGVLREEILRLGLEPIRSGIFIRDKDANTGRHFSFDDDGRPVEEVAALDEMEGTHLDAVTEARAAGEPFYHTVLTREYLDAYQGMIDADRSTTPARDFDVLDQAQGYWFIFLHGSLVVSFREELDDASTGALIRFSEVFGFAYERYQQIELKEQQNHQLRLDAALERVHAEVASMKTSDDVGRVIGLVYREIEGLGIDLSAANIIIYDEEAGETRQYGLLPQTLYDEGMKGTPAVSGIVEGLDLYPGDKPIADVDELTYRNWKSGTNWFGEVAGEVEAVRANLRTQFGVDLPEIIILRSQMQLQFSHGTLLFFSREEEEFDDGTMRAGSEFAEMVNLGYARYLDFQQLEAQNQALEQANEEIQEATRLKSQFLATMSHELRTPMNAIIGFTRLVLRRGAEKLDERQRGNLEKVMASAGHLLSLINDILDLSKVEAGRMDISAHTFELEPLIENACATVGPTLGKPSVNLEYDVEDGIGEVFTDESRLRQVVINLLSNALKFTDEDSVKVTVRQEAEGRSQEGGPPASSDLTISVSDTGIGIAPDELGNIFEQFRQVDGTSTRRHEGTGLGLAITKDLVELLGGEIGVASVVGEGSVFTIRIPSRYGEELSGGEEQSGRTGVERAGERTSPSAVSRPPSTEGGEASQPTPTSEVREAPETPPTADRPPPTSKRTIVSIDDDPNVAVLLRQELEDDGYSVISALNADEGVALVKQHQPIAVTVDILMPGKDGWQTIAMLKEDPATRDVPIVIVSAMDNRDLGFSLGVHDYVVKPFDRDALIGALGRIDTGEVKDVLVVDDEAVACDLICEILDDGGYTTRRAHNGREALDRIREQKPDAMFLDLMMPEMDGFAVIEALRGTDAASIPIIVVTAKDLTQEEEQYLAAHVNRVVQKGTLDPDDLVVTLREAIARYGG